MLGRGRAAALGWGLICVCRERKRRTGTGERRRAVGGEVDGWRERCVRVIRRRAAVAVQVRVDVVRSGHHLRRVVAVTQLRGCAAVIGYSVRERRREVAVMFVLIRGLIRAKVLAGMAGEDALAALDERLFHLDRAVRTVKFVVETCMGVC